MNRAVTGEISTCEQPTAHTDQPMLLLTKTMERPWSDEMMLSCVAGRRHCPWCQGQSGVLPRDAFLAVSNGTRVPAPCALRLRPGKVVACAQGMCDEDQPPCPRYVNGMPREQHTSCVSYLVK